MGLIGSLFQSVIWGYPLVCFMSYMFVQRPHLWLQLISRHKAVRSGAPNFAFQFCLDRVDPSQMDGVDLSSWRLAFCGAEPIRKSTLAAFAEKFAPYGFDARAFMACYGLAEATLLVSSAPPFSGITSQSLSRTGLTVGNFDQVPAGSDGSFDVVDCGVPANSLQVAIVDPQTLQVCPPGKIGEIWVAGPSIADGYWQSDISDAVFKAQRADAPDAGPYLRTGDLGAMQDGRLFVTGRLKEVIIINGRNFYPNDIELCLEESHSEIEKNNSVATTISGDKGESLSIFAQLNRRAVRDCDFDDVCRGISRSVSSTFGITPGRIVLLMPGEMPKSTSGKLQRVSLNHRFEQGALKTAHVHDLDGGLS
jgi:acyl-CoA synthetase (AMP-forming)/AMP-acid ligase II